MDIGIGKALAGDLDKSFHEVVVFFASHTALSETKVKFVIEQILILRSLLVNERTTGWVRTTWV
jgi:hypothetical protein